MTTADAIARALEFMRGGDASCALTELERLVARDPNSAAAHNALGAVLAALGQSQRAAESFRSALGLQPRHVHAATNLAGLRLADGRVTEAQRLCEQVIAWGRPLAQTHLTLGRALLLLGRSEAATRQFAHAIASPGAGAAVHSQACYASLLDASLSSAQVVAIHRGYETFLTAQLGNTAAAPPQTTHSSRARPILAYVSADFREHSVACFIEGVLAAHDKTAFDVVLYADVEAPDATTQRLATLATRLQSVARLDDEQLAARIRADQVDVLVDLAGHMQPNRLPVFARRPAPVLLTYLGYPGTTGLSLFDGRITDPWADPDDDRAIAGPEPLLRIEQGYLAYTPPADAPAVSLLPAASSDVITFGCFNDALKLSHVLLASWGEILARVPDSRLVLKARAFSSDDVRRRIVDELAELGVSDARIELLPAVPTRSEHLALYARVDLALDTFPYAGATTTCEALYMGVPVVSLAGDRHAGRLGASLLSAAGLPEFIATTRAAYVDLAVRHAGDIAALATLRRDLRTRLRTTPLFDAARIARFVERSALQLLRGDGS